MENIPPAVPIVCPACAAELLVTRLQCPVCSTEVAGTFALGQLATLREPYASLIELFLRVRGNMKEMERVLGVSYPTVRARLEDALAAAGLARDAQPPAAAPDLAPQRAAILDELERGEITPAEAAARLRAIQQGRGS